MLSSIHHVLTKLVQSPPSFFVFFLMTCSYDTIVFSRKWRRQSSASCPLLHCLLLGSVEHGCFFGGHDQKHTGRQSSRVKFGHSRDI